MLLLEELCTLWQHWISPLKINNISITADLRIRFSRTRVALARLRSGCGNRKDSEGRDDGELLEEHG